MPNTNKLLSHMNPRNARLIAWDAGAGVTDASTLGYKPGQVPGQRVWGHAADWGMVLTFDGRELLVTLEREAKDIEGEVTGWHYRGHSYVKGNARRDPKAVTLFVVNS
jgi:hypothetical protein